MDKRMYVVIVKSPLVGTLKSVALLALVALSGTNAYALIHRIDFGFSDSLLRSDWESGVEAVSTPGPSIPRVVSVYLDGDYDPNLRSWYELNGAYGRFNYSITGYQSPFTDLLPSYHGYSSVFHDIGLNPPDASWAYVARFQNLSNGSMFAEIGSLGPLVSIIETIAGTEIWLTGFEFTLREDPSQYSDWDYTKPDFSVSFFSRLMEEGTSLGFREYSYKGINGDLIDTRSGVGFTDHGVRVISITPVSAVPDFISRGWLLALLLSLVLVRLFSRSVI